jgi:predicted MFS family arabinose efflux permease
VLEAVVLTHTRNRGIGNLVGMPLAIAVGRRIVLLICTVILVVGAVLCATATSYNWHLGARMVIGISAGQSEALVPMITQVSRPSFVSNTH